MQYKNCKNTKIKNFILSMVWSCSKGHFSFFWCAVSILVLIGLSKWSHRVGKKSLLKYPIHNKKIESDRFWMVLGLKCSTLWPMSQDVSERMGASNRSSVFPAVVWMLSLEDFNDMFIAFGFTPKILQYMSPQCRVCFKPQRKHSTLTICLNLWRECS